MGDSQGGDHQCDTTIVELVIAEINGQGRILDLTKDVVDSIHVGNPHPDAWGNANVWRYSCITPMSAASEPPPFLLRRKYSRVKGLSMPMSGKSLNLKRLHYTLANHGIFLPKI